jgi:ribonuclease I
MPRKTTKKKIDKTRKTGPRRAVPLAVGEVRLHASPRRGKASTVKPARPAENGADSGTHEYDMMLSWSPLAILLRQQALATNMILSLSRIWRPK